MAPLPASFPPLPPCENETASWPSSIRDSWDRIATEYERVYTLLNLEDCDPLQISFHIDNVTSDCIPLLEALEGDGDVPVNWLLESAQLLGETVRELRIALTIYQGR